MKEIVIFALGCFIGWGMNAHSHNEDIKMPDLSSIPGLDALDAATPTPKEVKPKFPEHPSEMKKHMKAMSL
jgi:hypothetical protein